MNFTSQSCLAHHLSAWAHCDPHLFADPNASQALLDGARDGWLKYIKGTLIEERGIYLVCGYKFRPVQLLS